MNGLDEIAELGFGGVEGIEAFYRDYSNRVEQALLLLTERRLSLAALEFSGEFAHPDREELLFKECLARADFLKQIHSSLLVLDLGSREVYLSEREDFKLIADRLNRLALRSNERNVKIAVRNQWGRRIQSEADIDRLLNLLDLDIVSFCVDAGHLYRAQESPASIIQIYGECLRHLYLQDAVIDSGHKEGGYFCEPGEGAVDFNTVRETLKGIHYSGWLTVRMDAPANDPSETAHNIYLYLKKHFSS